MFARRFTEAGFGVLDVDHRHMGERGGQRARAARQGAARRRAGRDRCARGARCPESTRPQGRDLELFSSAGHVFLWRSRRGPTGPL